MGSTGFELYDPGRDEGSMKYVTIGVIALAGVVLYAACMRCWTIAIVAAIRYIVLKLLGVKVECERVRMNVCSLKLGVRGLSIYNPKGFSEGIMMTIDRVYINLSMTRLLCSCGRRSRVESLELDGLRAEMEMTMHGSNFANLLERVKHHKKMLEDDEDDEDDSEALLSSSDDDDPAQACCEALVGGISAIGASCCSPGRSDGKRKKKCCSLKGRVKEVQVGRVDVNDCKVRVKAWPVAFNVQPANINYDDLSSSMKGDGLGVVITLILESMINTAGANLPGASWATQAQQYKERHHWLHRGRAPAASSSESRSSSESSVGGGRSCLQRLL